MKVIGIGYQLTNEYQVDRYAKKESDSFDGWRLVLFFRSICWLVTKHKKVMFLATLKTRSFSTAALTCIGTDFFSGQLVVSLPNIRKK